MRIILSILLAATGIMFSMASANAGVNVRVNLSSQTMSVSVNGQHRHTWAISSGKAGYSTPRGSYRPTVMRRMHYSSKYNNSPMPHSIFFRGGYAIHGTGYSGALGRPASHGCIRLSKGNAARLFALVKRNGAGKTRISISGSPKFRTAKRKRRRAKPAVAGYVKRRKVAKRKKRKRVKANTVGKRVVKKKARKRKWKMNWGF